MPPVSFFYGQYISYHNSIIKTLKSAILGVDAPDGSDAPERGACIQSKLKVDGVHRKKYNNQQGGLIE